MASSYHLSSSVPFGFSIQEAIKELSLEEDGDVDTFLNKSAALMAAASPPSLTAFSRSYLLSNSDENPSLSLITLQKASLTEEEKLGSKEYLMSLIVPAKHETPQSTTGSWEMVPMREIESNFGVSVRSSTRSRHSCAAALKSDGTPVKSLKYLIRTPPRPTAVPGSLPSSVGSAPSFSGFSSSGDVTSEPYRDIHLWPALEDFLVTVPEWANCSICSELFDEPVEWPGCAHIFCKACVTRILTYGHRECPLCRGPVPNDFGFEDLVHSTRMASAISLLPSRCRWGLISYRKQKENVATMPLDLGSTPSSSSAAASLSHVSFGVHSGSYGSPSSSISSIDACMKESSQATTHWMPLETANGCPEIVPLSSLPEHHQTCLYSPARCLFPTCRQIFPRKDIELHQQNCLHRPETCSSCFGIFSRLTLPSHMATCSEAEISCECGYKMLRKAFSEHKHTTCIHAELSCPFAKHGCLHIGPRKDLEDHLDTCPYEALKGYITHTERRFQEYDKTIERLESMILALRSQVHQNNPRVTSRPANTSSYSTFSQHDTSQPNRSTSSTSPFSLGTSTGPVGHGNRKNRFWDDDGRESDDDDSMMFF
jgi:hypothetical protein